MIGGIIGPLFMLRPQSRRPDEAYILLSLLRDSIGARNSHIGPRLAGDRTNKPAGQYGGKGRPGFEPKDD